MTESEQLASSASEYDHMEPEALKNVKGMHQDNSLFTIQSAAVVSIAISLKRIADALSYQPGPDNLYDIVRGIRDKD